MSLTTALIVFALELVIAGALVFTARSPSIRRRRLAFVFGAFAALTLFWTFGLAGTDEVHNQTSGSTWIALILASVNALIFVKIQDAPRHPEA